MIWLFIYSESCTEVEGANYLYMVQITSLPPVRFCLIKVTESERKIVQRLCSK